MSDEKFELTAEIKHVTDRSILIFDGDVECWIPTQYISSDDEIERGVTITIEVPEWIAIKNRLV